MDKIIKSGPTKKDRLTAELNKLEQELNDLGSAVSDAQVWHKKARIESIKKELAELNADKANKFNAGADKLNQEMMMQQMMQRRGGMGD